MSRQIESAALELVDRHGVGALDVANERVELLTRSGDPILGKGPCTLRTLGHNCED